MQIAVHPLVFNKDCVLAVKGKDGLWRLPKAILREGETLVEAAKRGLLKEAGVEALCLCFSGIYDAVDRSPNGRELAAVMMVQAWRENKPEELQKEIAWIGNYKETPLALDHNFILDEQGIFSRLSSKVLPFEARNKNAQPV
jgi:ADP-ribose pyrophosphatase YjhB (NUDIX family)